MSEPRRVLPQRRASETFTVIHWNQPFTVTAGEVFVDACEAGGDVEAIARDAAVVISLALQHGVRVEAIKHAITRGSCGAPSSILGAVVDCISAHSFGGER